MLERINFKISYKTKRDLESLASSKGISMAELSRIIIENSIYKADESEKKDELKKEVSDLKFDVDILSEQVFSAQKGILKANLVLNEYLKRVLSPENYSQFFKTVNTKHGDIVEKGIKDLNEKKGTS